LSRFQFLLERVPIHCSRKFHWMLVAATSICSLTPSAFPRLHDVRADILHTADRPSLLRDESVGYLNRRG